MKLHSIFKLFLSTLNDTLIYYIGLLLKGAKEWGREERSDGKKEREEKTNRCWKKRGRGSTIAFVETPLTELTRKLDLLEGTGQRKKKNSTYPIYSYFKLTIKYFTLNIR